MASMSYYSSTRLIHKMALMSHGSMEWKYKIHKATYPKK